MDRLDILKTFTRVVETGSFSAAAREAGRAQSAISKQIASLEGRLGVQLLRRTSRNLSLTEAGRDLYESALRIIEDVDAAEARAGARQAAPCGVLRVTAAHAFSRLHVVPALPRLRALYPDLTVEMLVSERTSNLVEEGIDLAIRNGDLTDSTLVARRIGGSAVVCVASAEYLSRHSMPARPIDLIDHDGVTFVAESGPRALSFLNAGMPTVICPPSAFRSNDAEQLRAAVLAGIGVAQAPLWLFDHDIHSGLVTRILIEHEPEPLSIFAVRPAGRRPPNKVTVFVDFLVDLLSNRGF